MTFPNGSGGYQVGAGNLSEVLLVPQPPPTQKSGTATLTAAELANGIVYFTGTAPTTTLTLPDASDLDVSTATYSAPMSNAKPNTAFDVCFINIGTGTLVVNATTNPGWSAFAILNNIGSTVSALVRFVKTANGEWSIYRLS